MLGGFQLRKWITNFKKLQKHINQISCEVNSKSCVKNLLVVEWDVSKDEFIFMFSDIMETAVMTGYEEKYFKNINYVHSFRTNMSIGLQVKLFPGSMYTEC